MVVRCDPAEFRRIVDGGVIDLNLWQLFVSGLVLMLFLPSTQSQTGFLEKKLAEGVGMLESAEIGNGFERLVRVEQKLFGSFQSYGLNLVKNRVSDGLCETKIGHAP